MEIHHAQLAAQILKLSLHERLDEDVCRLRIGCNVRKHKITRVETFMNEVTINFNVLHALMEDRILSYMYCSLTITREMYRMRMKDSQISKKRFLTILTHLWLLPWSDIRLQLMIKRQFATF